jgi:antibiotic biosynthesis monooxygenase (ABM) superfamily enzyme
VLLAGASLDHWPFLVVKLIVTVLFGFLLTYVGLPPSTRPPDAWL